MNRCPGCGLYGGVCDATGHVDDGLCPDCVLEGYEESPCGCIYTPLGKKLPCSTDHQVIVDADPGDESYDIAKEDEAWEDTFNRIRR